jgi:hypothetical protein
MKKSVFAKVSGDVFKAPDFISYIGQVAQTRYVLVCVGGGSQINEAFKKAGISLGRHGPLGREIRSQKGKELARDVLNRNCNELKAELRRRGISAGVIIPVLNADHVICHVNGDQFVRTMYLGFDELIVFTTFDRVEKKRTEFKDLSKVQVIGIMHTQPTV